SSFVESKYPLSSLTLDSQMYSRNCRTLNFYYETFQLNVITSGFYSISTRGQTDTFGYIYQEVKLIHLDIYIKIILIHSIHLRIYSYMIIITYVKMDNLNLLLNLNQI